MKLGIDDISNEKVSPIAEVQPKTEMGMVAQLCKLMDILVAETKFDVNNFDQEYLFNMFLFAMTWGLGSCIMWEERVRFNKFISALIEKQGMDFVDKNASKNLFNVYLKVEENDVKFTPWKKLKTD